VALANLILLLVNALGLRLLPKQFMGINIILYLLKTVSFVIIPWLFTGQDKAKEM
jgi:hypothetical protein